MIPLDEQEKNTLDVTNHAQAAWEQIALAHAEIKNGNSDTAVHRANDALRVIGTTDADLFLITRETVPIDIDKASKFVAEAQERVSAATMTGPW